MTPGPQTSKCTCGVGFWNGGSRRNGAVRPHEPPGAPLIRERPASLPSRYLTGHKFPPGRDLCFIRWFAGGRRPTAHRGTQAGSGDFLWTMMSTSLKIHQSRWLHQQHGHHPWPSSPGFN
ncbi:hypothetical protein PGTUg99_001597 [Puccinia graminis f. sp. tritici]|uniref:Uncharacterized protein n=1 Tax=Puccinia graminis f. sp. tritici TaxID=56615 RepID=A0A5B0PQ08_PUCGR|nr:hypothetical protein PGTUg99_001597 [Puccinia graminis f. sp. tritici]